MGGGESAYSLTVFEPVEKNVKRVSMTLDEGLSKSFRGIPEVPMEQLEALEDADIVILAIPSGALKNFVSQNLHRLTGSILVDCTNAATPSDDLKSVLEDIGADNEFKWVKAFNDTGAIELINHKVTNKSLVPTKMCGPNGDAVMEVKAFAEKALGFDVKVVPFKQFELIANHQNSLGKEWLHATCIMVTIFVATTICSIIRDHTTEFYGSTLPWRHLPLHTANHSMAWTCIWGFAFSQLPGVIARLCITFGKHQLPGWLLWALNIRKHLGLVSLFFLVNHAIISLTIWNPGHFCWAYEDPSNIASKHAWHVETALFFGILGFCLHVILGICSLPSVAASMTSRQWSFVHGTVAWTALAFGLMHDLIIGKDIMRMNIYWPNNIPHVTVMSCTIPIGVFGLKVIQVFISNMKNLCKSSKPKSSEDVTFRLTDINDGKQSDEENPSDVVEA